MRRTTKDFLFCISCILFAFFLGFSYINILFKILLLFAGLVVEILKLLEERFFKFGGEKMSNIFISLGTGITVGGTTLFLKALY